MRQEELDEVVRKAAPAGVLSCEAARGLAGDNGIELSEIGKACNRLNIKISSCELGCF